MCRFCPYSMNYLQIVCLLNAGLEHSRSNLVFETSNNFIFRMLYFIWETTFGITCMQFIGGCQCIGEEGPDSVLSVPIDLSQNHANFEISAGLI